METQFQTIKQTDGLNYDCEVKEVFTGVDRFARSLVYVTLINPGVKMWKHSSTVKVEETLRTVTWSLHQYHVASIVSPSVMPGQGRSPVTASLNKCMASWRGRWQLLLGMIFLGTAMLYTRSRFS